MELIFGVENLQPCHRPCVATIGNYDGVHLGHQSVISGLVDKGRELGVPSAVITFEPLAKEYFQKAGIGGRLTTLEERAELLGQHGVDQVLCLAFNSALAGQPPGDFVRQVLVDGLKIRYLVVGDDFRYGRDRAGDFSTLEQAGEEFGFDLKATESFMLGPVRVSSGRVREALRDGNIDVANQMLGRPYRIAGIVAHGDELGRTIGFPTANIGLDERDVPVRGVFAVRAECGKHGRLEGVANVGSRPTVDGEQMRLEVHLLNFDADIYGQDIAVEFVEKIRGEKKFSGLDELKQQIHLDIEEAKRIFTG